MRILLMICISCSVLISKADYWTQKANYPGGARIFGMGLAIGNKGYIGSGADIFGDTSAFWEFDPALNIWNQKSDFAGSMREAGVCFSIGNKGYFGTGADIFNGIGLVDFWEYDPLINAWTQKADFGGIGRGSAIGFSIAGKGYVGTGNDISSSIVLKDFWEYDPVVNTWSQKNDFGGLELMIATGFSNGTKGYIGTGTDNTIHPYGKNQFWEYDPLSDIWTQKAAFGGIGRSEACSFWLCDYGYIGTGTSRIGTFNEAKSDFWKYEFATNTWTQATNFGGGVREVAVAFSIGSKGYVGTGFANDDFNTIEDDFWEYTPDDLCVTGVEEFGVELLQFSVSPNPVHDHLVLNSNLLTQKNISILIIDTTGKIIFSTTCMSKLSNFIIESKYFRKGVYFIKVVDGNQIAVGKFVKV